MHFGKQTRTRFLASSEGVFVRGRNAAASRPTCYLPERCSVSRWLRSVIRSRSSVSPRPRCRADGTETQRCSVTNDSHCQTGRRGRTQRWVGGEGAGRVPLYKKKKKKTLSISSRLSCCASPQYSLKSFKGTSEAFCRMQTYTACHLLKDAFIIILFFLFFF